MYATTTPYGSIDEAACKATAGREGYYLWVHYGDSTGMIKMKQDGLIDKEDFESCIAGKSAFPAVPDF